jgi:hypothetical protein
MTEKHEWLDVEAAHRRQKEALAEEALRPATVHQVVIDVPVTLGRPATLEVGLVRGDIMRSIFISLVSADMRPRSDWDEAMCGPWPTPQTISESHGPDRHGAKGAPYVRFRIESERHIKHAPGGVVIMGPPADVIGHFESSDERNSARGVLGPDGTWWWSEQRWSTL